MTQPDRLLDLLASRATEGLSETEDRELSRLLANHDEMSLDYFEEAAALADLAFTAGVSGGPSVEDEPMPADLRQRVLAEASSSLAAPIQDDSDRFRETPAQAPRKDNLFSSRYLGWYAAAAILVLALWAPWTSKPGTPVPVRPVAVATVAEQREALLEEAGDLIRVNWAPPEIEEYAGVRGDVVWSPGKQTGFMRLVGLPANLPTEKQYQLWIVDPGRDQHPIDGGVFDIAGDAGEVIVPIDAKLAVGQVAAFAITLEKPGGVVVSAGPLLVVAPVA